MKLETPIVAIGEILWDLLPTGPRVGGAPFNFAFHCHRLGHPAIMVSRVGNDDLGRALRTEVRRLGMSDEYIQIDPEHPTGTVKVKLDAVGQPTYTITETVAWDFLEWDERLWDLAQPGGAGCFGTLARRHPRSRETIRQFFESARSSRLVVCDINLRPPFVDRHAVVSSVRLADWIKVNEDEATELVRMLGTPWEEVFPDDELGHTDADDLFGATGKSLVCITRGRNGAHIRTSNESIRVPGIAAKVADTVGAGDAFTAALLTQHLEGKSLREAARFANAYAAVVVSKPGGTPTVNRAEVERLL